MEILCEIPDGSLPLNTLYYTKSMNMTLPSYTTQQFEYFFYFPLEGKFNIYPSNASRNSQVVSKLQST